MQRFETAARHCIQNTEQEDCAVDTHVTFAQRHLITNDTIANELTRLQPRVGARIAEILETCHSIKGLDSGNMRFLQWIIRLFAKQEKGSEPELMAERFVNCINNIGRDF